MKNNRIRGEFMSNAMKNRFTTTILYSALLMFGATSHSQVFEAEDYDQSFDLT